MGLLKQFILLVIGFVIIITTWYLISPLFIVVEIDEPAPVSTVDTIEAPEGADPTVEQALEEKIEELAKDSVKEQQPTRASKTGNFVASAHDVEGEALLIEHDGSRTLRFENFDTVNGPDLFIYLATDTSATDFVNLGEIKATKGNVNYDIPSDVDIEKYDTVLVWCRAFSVLFSYAELS